jgi:hypothetical protein
MLDDLWFRIFSRQQCGKCVSRQAVDCFGRQSDDFARWRSATARAMASARSLGELVDRDFGFHCVEDSRGARSALADAISTLAPSAVRCPIFLADRGSCFP